MAALGRDPGGLEARRPAADDQHGSRGRGGLNSVAVPRPFAAGRRVHEARDPVVARAAAPAQLIARDARADLVGPIGARLGDHMRVGDLPAHDADQVGLAGGQHRLGRLGRPDVALGLHDSVRDDALERGGKRDAELLLVQRDRDDRIEVEVRPGAARDVVHGVTLVVPRDDLGELVHRQRRLGALVHAHRQPDDERRRRTRAGCRPGPSTRTASAPRTSRPTRRSGGSTTASRTDRRGRDTRRRPRPRRSRPPAPAARPRRSPSMTSSISASVIAWLPSASWYDGSPDGDQFGAKELSASPCCPTWYSCWIITMSGFASRQASVSRRKCGTIASSSGRKLPRVRTAVRCTGTGSTTIIPAPPSARSR